MSPNCPDRRGAEPVQQAVCRPALDGRIHGRPTVAGTAYAVPRIFGPAAAKYAG